nr:MAG TPA_asm: hypothetical protein [Caudoviricetes sp.]
MHNAITSLPVTLLGHCYTFSCSVTFRFVTIKPRIFNVYSCFRLRLQRLHSFFSCEKVFYITPTHIHTHFFIIYIEK